MILTSTAVIAAALSLATDPALLRLVPADATSVIGLDVEQGKNSPFGQFMLSRIKTEGVEFEKMIRATGFDPRRDLRDVYVSTPAAQPNRGLILARGVFDQSRFLAAAKAEGGQTLVYQGLNVIAGKDAANDRWIAFLDSNTVAAGPREAVQAVIARRAPNSPAHSAYGQLLDLANRYDTWMYSLEPASTLRSLPNNQNAQVFRAVEQVSAGAKFGANVAIAGRAVTRTERDAIALQDVVRFLASMIQMNAPEGQPRDAANLLNSLVLSTSGNVMTLSLSVPQTEIERLIEQSAGRTRRAPQSIE